MPPDPAPLVSVVIPVRDEAAHVRACVRCFLDADWPADRLEVLVVDGMSIDGTREELERLSREDGRVRVLDNPGRTAPKALNIGIREARGEYVLRADAHADYPPHYVRECIRLLQATGAANVGGPLEARAKGYGPETIATAVTHPFGVGDARFRISRTEQWVDTVFPGAWRRETLQSLGGFDEAWTVNQDYELNVRLRKQGGRILLSPTLACGYHPRRTLGALAKQYFRYGMWRVKTVFAHPRSLRARQLAAPLLVLGLLASAALAPFRPLHALALPALYATALLLGSLHAALRARKPAQLVLLPFVFATLHLSWGLGFLAGLFRFAFRQRAK